MNIFEFLDELNKSKIYFYLSQVRDSSIMVEVSVPGERWEIEFFKNGEIEVEIFKSDGNIHGPEILKRLFDEYGE